MVAGAAGDGFGVTVSGRMPLARFDDQQWTGPEVVDPIEFRLHPAAHALHYGSACFEGLKAHRGTDGKVRVFRTTDHVRRLRQSAASMLLPVPPASLVAEMIELAVAANIDDVPPAPSSLYIRPTLVGTTANIGAATRPSESAALYVLTSPGGDYFGTSSGVLTLLVEDSAPRTTADFGMVKAGANYVLALRRTVLAREASGADQVLFCRGGLVEETGASNFFLVADGSVITPQLTSAFLHGITRDTLLHLARRRGLVVEERPLPADELLERVRRPRAEAGLSGTGAGLAPVGILLRAGRRTRVGSGHVGPIVSELQRDLAALHQGVTDDPHGWLRVVDG